MMISRTRPTLRSSTKDSDALSARQAAKMASGKPTEGMEGSMPERKALEDAYKAKKKELHSRQP